MAEARTLAALGVVRAGLRQRSMETRTAAVSEVCQSVVHEDTKNTSTVRRS